MQILDADGARFDGVESGPLKQCYDLRETDVAMPVAEVLPKAPSFRLGTGEVNAKYPAAGFDDSLQLGRKLSAAGSAEVMKPAASASLCFVGNLSRCFK